MVPNAIESTKSPKALRMGLLGPVLGITPANGMLIEAVTIADLKKWFETRIEEGFSFVLPEPFDGN